MKPSRLLRPHGPSTTGAARCGALVLLVVLVGIAAAVFGGRDSDSAAAVKIPPCARTRTTVALPRAFPALPLPHGTAVRTVKRFGSYTVVQAVAPMNIAAAIRFVQRAYPRAGYPLGAGDAEPPYEAETAFAGHGFGGRIKFHSILKCTGAVTLALAVRRVP
jgi:hypothetical protein